MAPPSYDCDLCPAYCCSYPRVVVSKKDLKRLAAHFGIGLETARKKFTKKGEAKGERVLRHRKDHIYKSVCRFLDRESRGCTVYDTLRLARAAASGRCCAASTSATSPSWPTSR